MLQGLLDLIALLRYVAQIRASRERFTLYKDINSYCDAQEDEIRKLQNSGSADDLRRAGILQLRYSSAIGIVGNLPTAPTINPGQQTNPNTTGPVHPAG